MFWIEVFYYTLSYVTFYALHLKPMKFEQESKKGISNMELVNTVFLIMRCKKGGRFMKSAIEEAATVSWERVEGAE